MSLSIDNHWQTELFYGDICNLSPAFPVYKNGELICVGIYLTRMCGVIFVVVAVRHWVYCKMYNASPFIYNPGCTYLEILIQTWFVFSFSFSFVILQFQIVDGFNGASSIIFIMNFIMLIHVVTRTELGLTLHQLRGRQLSHSLQPCRNPTRSGHRPNSPSVASSLPSPGLLFTFFLVNALFSLWLQCPCLASLVGQ